MIEKLIFNWNSISLEINYRPNYLKNTYSSVGQLAHIEVRADCPLPITRTGYRSIFISYEEVEEHGGAIALVKAMLDEKSNSKEWQAYEKEQQQMNLF